MIKVLIRTSPFEMYILYLERQQCSKLKLMDWLTAQ